MAMVADLGAELSSQHSDSAERVLRKLCSFNGVVEGFLVAMAVAAILMAKLRTPRMKLPPGPRITLPIVGNWWQVSAIMPLLKSIESRNLFWFCNF